MHLADKRISLDPQPQRVLTSDLDVVLVGHCPGRCRSERLSDAARDEIRRLGYGERMQALEDGSAPDAARELYDLPLPIRSLADFEAIFPDARSASVHHVSRLTGRHAWLPTAVEHYFSAATDLPAGARRLWIIRVTEDVTPASLENSDTALLPFLPARRQVDLSQPETLRGAEVALLIPDAGLLVLPDLERISIPRALQHPDRLRLANPEPAFTPCSQRYDDTHRERSNPDEMPTPENPIAFIQVLLRLSVLLENHRPDMQALLAVPFRGDDELRSGRIAAETLAAIHTAIDRDLPLHRLQLVYPYLRLPDLSLTTPSGVLAGTIAHSSQTRGAWRSVAGRPLIPYLPAFPRLSPGYAAQLRESPGIGVLLGRPGETRLDDERLAASERALRRYSRSAEAVRFLGYLQRTLRRLGERLVFDLDPADPRPRMALETFFTRLHERGALAGARPDEAFEIRQHPTGPQGNHIAFDIEIAPALPIDHIRLTFSHSRSSAQAEWQWELRNG